jgi:hypothetical protein
MSLVAALLSLLVACGSGQPPHRGDAGDGGGRDGATDRVTQPPADARDDGPVASADGAADARLRAHAHVAADAGDAGPRCTLGTAVNCAACGDPACTLANTLMACTSADQCGRAVCAAGFGNCKASSLDCETSFAAGGTCLPRYEGTTVFATDYTYTSSTAIGTDGSFFPGRSVPRNGGLRSQRRSRRSLGGQRSGHRRLHHQAQRRRELRLDAELPGVGRRPGGDGTNDQALDLVELIEDLDLKTGFPARPLRHQDEPRRPPGITPGWELDGNPFTDHLDVLAFDNRKKLRGGTPSDLWHRKGHTALVRTSDAPAASRPLAVRCLLYVFLPTASMAAFDGEGRVVYVGSLSKLLSPSLRIGYVSAPKTVTQRLGAEVTMMDRQVIPRWRPRSQSSSKRESFNVIPAK